MSVCDPLLTNSADGESCHEILWEGISCLTVPLSYLVPLSLLLFQAPATSFAGGARTTSAAAPTWWPSSRTP